MGHSYAITGLLPAYYRLEHTAGVTNFPEILYESLAGLGHLPQLVSPKISTNRQFSKVFFFIGPYFWADRESYLEGLESLGVYSHHQVVLCYDDSNIRDAFETRKALDYFDINAGRLTYNQQVGLQMVGGYRYANRLVPAYAWSKVRRFMPTDPASITLIDPTPMQRVPNIHRHNIRDFEWISAARKVHSRWWLKTKQPISWPILEYGGPGQEHLSESRLNQLYGFKRGMLLTSSTPPSSCWWRNRMKVAAEARCIVVGHPTEMSYWGWPYCIAPDQVEGMSPDSLVNLAEEQYQAFYERAGTVDQFYSTLEKFL